MKRAAIASVSGLTLVVLTATGGSASVSTVSRVSGASPFAADCNGAPQSGTLYRNSEVEPFVAANPRRPGNLVAVWQQDRFSDGGANGLLAGFSTDGGRSWTNAASPPFTHCAGGSAANGGDFERASDPWVSFAPDGTAYFISLVFNDTNPINGVTVSMSRDGGGTWERITTLLNDTDPRFFNDKESITADPTNSRFVYAVWDRLFQSDPTQDDFFGPTFLARTTDGGRSWEPARAIFDPGLNNQTIGNQIVVLPDGTVLDVFDLIIGDQTFVALIRSTDHGRTWSRTPVVVSPLGTIGVSDPRDGAPVRTGDILPEVAVDPRPGHRDVYLVWQDARFSGGLADQVAFSRSRDGGRSWSPPVRLSPPGVVQAFTPSIDVDEHGQVAVTYYDFTSDTTSPSLDTDTWAIRSADGGRTWTARESLTPAPFDMRNAPDAGGFFTGDYEGLATARAIDSGALSVTRLAPARPCVHFVYVDDVDTTYRAGLAAGATSIMAPTDQPWGDRCCGLVDPFDNRWWVATHLRDFS